MSKVTKIWLITAASLIVLGCLIFTGGIIMAKGDFKKLSTVKYETNTYTVEDEFKNISIKTDTADIKFELSDDGICKVVCFEEKKEKHKVSVNDETLTINRVSKKHWYEHIGIGFKSPKITVYLPQNEYASLIIKESTGNIALPKAFTFESVDISLSTGDVDFFAAASGSVKIKGSTGKINIEAAFADSFDISVSTGDVTATSVACKGEFKAVVTTGKVKLNDVSCGSISSKGSTGAITLENVVAEGSMNITRSTGDVKLKECDAAELFLKTDTGDVKGSLLSDKVFITKTDTGSVNVPKTITGGRCEIETDTGDIKITIE